MKISKPTQKLASKSSSSDDLSLFVTQPEPMQKAVCDGCQQHTPETCSGKCPNAATALSIEPDRYPIEPNVVGVVYELMATRLIQTCWSCEGHMNDAGELWKIPQICFYTASPIYVKLLCSHLAKLHHQKLLNYPWHIVLTDFSQTNELTYSIQPNLNDIKQPHLGSMQADLRAISVDMHSKLKNHAIQILKAS